MRCRSLSRTRWLSIGAALCLAAGARATPLAAQSTPAPAPMLKPVLTPRDLGRWESLGATRLPAEDWVPYLTGMLNSNADVAILKIKHKPSFVGGTVWADSEATPQQLAATKRFAGRTP